MCPVFFAPNRSFCTIQTFSILKMMLAPLPVSRSTAPLKSLSPRVSIQRDSTTFESPSLRATPCREAISTRFRSTIAVLTLLIAFVIVTAIPGHAAKYAGDAFSLGVGGRSLGLGGATVAGPFDASAPYWNPAGMLALDGQYIMAMHAETFGSLLNHDFVSYVNARPHDSSMVRAWGVYLYYLGGGGIKITQLDQYNRPYVVKEESHGDYLLAGSVAGRLSEKADFGLSGKIIYRDIGTETGIGLTIDAGGIYRIHPKATLGLMVNDLTTGFIRYSGKTFGTGGNTESIYPTVRPSIMINHQHHDFTGRLLFTGDIKFESLKQSAQLWVGTFSMDTHYGFEIDWREMAFGRVGFDIGRLTLGAGAAVQNFSLDLAYLHDADFDATFRVSGGYRW